MRKKVKRVWGVVGSSVGEVVLIVSGILIAFILDAWWDDRVEQAEVQKALHAVRLDFVSTRFELSAVEEANRTYVENVARLMALGLDDVVNLDAATSLELTGLLPTGGLTFDPVLGSVDALISSGQLHKVGNVQLRSAIAAWPALMDEIGEDQEILIDMYMAQQERSVELGLYFLSFENELGGEPRNSESGILARVVADPEMLNRLAAHKYAIEELGRELKVVAEHLDLIMSLLDQEIGAGN